MASCIHGTSSEQTISVQTRQSNDIWDLTPLVFDTSTTWNRNLYTKGHRDAVENGPLRSFHFP